MSTQESTVIDTPYGMFRVSDSRGPVEDYQNPFLTLYPVGPIKINGKTYAESYYHLTRHTFRHGGEFYVSGGWNSSLTDSAREKLKVALEVLDTEYPPLTHAEKVRYVTDHAVSSARHKLEYDVLGTVTDALQSARMTRSSRGDAEDPVTDAERAGIRAAVLQEVSAWLDEQLDN